MPVTRKHVECEIHALFLLLRWPFLDDTRFGWGRGNCGSSSRLAKTLSQAASMVVSGSWSTSFEELPPPAHARPRPKQCELSEAARATLGGAGNPSRGIEHKRRRSCLTSGRQAVGASCTASCGARRLLPGARVITIAPLCFPPEKDPRPTYAALDTPSGPTISVCAGRVCSNREGRHHCDITTDRSSSEVVQRDPLLTTPLLVGLSTAHPAAK